MRVAIELPPAQAAQLQGEATRLGIAPEAAKRILERNAELYQRLA